MWLEVRERQHPTVRGRLRGAFSPTPGLPAVPLPQVHRRLSEWLRCAAIGELLASGLIYQY